MQCPKHLKNEAAEFWRKHAPELQRVGLLKPTDAEGFALLCEVYRLIRTTDPEIDSKHAILFVSLLKQYQQLAKQFGLLPKDRAKLFKEKQQLDEFGL